MQQQKVYLLMKAADFDGLYVHSAYSTLEKAHTARDKEVKTLAKAYQKSGPFGKPMLPTRAKEYAAEQFSVASHVVL